MDFQDTQEEAGFRAEARAWIQGNAPTHLLEELSRAPFGNLVLKHTDAIQEGKAWQRKKHAAGWGCPAWPRQFGGRECSPIQQAIWHEEEGHYSKLGLMFLIGTHIAGPAIMHWGTDAQKAQLLPAVATGEQVMCQLFSEPAAGSDLAGVQTRATSDGTHWKVNGQKIWTSGAKDADLGILLARTDPGALKHKGLTMFWVDMRSPGITIQPIKQINGDTHFNQIFMTDLTLSDSQRIGPVGKGWEVALTVLSNERLSVGQHISTGFDDLVKLANAEQSGHWKPIEDPALQSRLVHLAVRDAGLANTMLRSYTALSKGRLPGPENTILKLVAGRHMQEIAALAFELQGASAMLFEDGIHQEGDRFQQMFLRAPGTRIEGGTDEVMRNIIAERILMLPSDLRADKGVPFNAIPTSA